MKEKSKIPKPIFIMIISSLLFAVFILGFTVRLITEDKEQRAFREMMKIINENSVVVPSVTFDELAENGFESVLKEDNYARYFSKEEYKKSKKEDKGDYSGFGFSFVGNTNKVNSVVYNSPCEKGGVKSGDIIKTITVFNEEKKITDFDTLSSAISNLKAGDSAKFDIERANGEQFSLVMQKENYKAGYIRYADSETELRVRTNEKGEYYLKEFSQNKNALLDNRTAYIEMTEFSGGLTQQLKLALNHAKENGKDQLILDLRNNGGGQLSVLQDVCSLIMPTTAKSGSLLVNAKLKSDETNFCLEKKGTNDFIKNTVVLANKNTASASEALIGAMAHYGAGGFSLDKLVCEYNDKREDYSTFGKGIMQTTFTLSNGGAIKLTTAKIYWPDKSTCIHDVGVKPTLEKNCIKNSDSIKRALEILAV